ncbi:MAG: tryptophan-rich sensory protein [Deltaproteobacteria bacterium]|nr:tryptophan-rich sensory protein [Deltaproteobacteria bacterium]MDQ3299116.1 tryptophan-rich sensory protein [Myxococcota bacterium]
MTGLPNVSPFRHATLLVGCLVASFAPGMFGVRFQPGDWYAQLAKSPLTPPGWVFPIAWSALYITIGVALYIMWVHTSWRERRIPLAVFAIQLVLNGAWSWLFFGRHAVGAALLEIGVLWISIVAMAFAFARHSRFAGKLLLPYLAWVSFATYLNFEIWRANA